MNRPFLTLITGGAKCGKSAFALRLALTHYHTRTFVATAVSTDSEMSLRISRHRFERGDLFQTIEEPIHLGRILSNLPGGTDVAVVDCLTVWLGNLYHQFGGHEDQVRNQVEAFLSDLDRVTSDIIFVTNEVGWGIVPENALSRSFRDLAGDLNQRVAEKSSHVYLVCAGIPLALKGGLRENNEPL